MDEILLGFCLTSLTITGLIVIIELVHERKRYEKFSKEESLQNELNSLSSMSTADLDSANDSMIKPQISQRVFVVLRQQLHIFGYRSDEQQMHFLNRLLGSNYQQISELGPLELRKVFAEIHRYKSVPLTSQSIGDTPLAQSA